MRSNSLWFGVQEDKEECDAVFCPPGIVAFCIMNHPVFVLAVLHCDACRHDYHDAVFNLLTACIRLGWGVLLFPMGLAMQSAPPTQRASGFDPSRLSRSRPISEHISFFAWARQSLRTSTCSTVRQFREPCTEHSTLQRHIRSSKFVAPLQPH